MKCSLSYSNTEFLISISSPWYMVKVFLSHIFKTSTHLRYGSSEAGWGCCLCSGSVNHKPEAIPSCIVWFDPSVVGSIDKLYITFSYKLQTRGFCWKYILFIRRSYDFLSASCHSSILAVWPFWHKIRI